MAMGISRQCTYVLRLAYMLILKGVATIAVGLLAFFALPGYVSHPMRRL
jgi:hypothetical protein